METIDLEMKRGKTRIVADLLDGECHFRQDPLRSYHAARAVANAARRVGVERRAAAVRKATKDFSVVVSVTTNPHDIPRVRLYVPGKRTEVLL